jgi:NitT/TauT family transport system permease protein
VIIDQPLYLPSVFDSFKHVWIIVRQESFWLNVAATFLRVVMGLLISSSLAVLIAVLSSMSGWVERFFTPFLTTLKSVPTMSIIILALVWFKSGNVPIFVSFMICFPMFYTNTLTGIKKINPALIEYCDLHQIKFKRKFTDVIIPSVWPYFRSAFFVSIGFCWKSTIAAEVLSAPKSSMGFELYLTKLYLNNPELFAWTIIIVGFTMLIEKILIGLIAKQRQPNYEH